MVAFGLGGVFVEVLKRVGGRLAPLTAADAERAGGRVRRPRGLDGFRGTARVGPGTRWPTRCAPPASWSPAAATGSSSIDINPLIVTEQGLVAVDCVCLVRDTRPIGTEEDAHG